MKNIQEIFNEIQNFKKTRKEIGNEYRDALFQAAGYEDLKEEMKKLRDKKKLIETGVRADMGSRFEELEKAKREEDFYLEAFGGWKKPKGKSRASSKC